MKSEIESTNYCFLVNKLTQIGHK